ncbi:MAG: alpha-ketoglutaric semialdehyde dehydrogenase [Verrucomicrobiales bacterium]|jgi:2,5-dioxopentanoate dehydrogenase
MSMHGHSIIAGIASTSGSLTFHAQNPATLSALEPGFVAATEADVNAACTAAAEAFAAVRPTPACIAQLLNAAADEIEALGDALIERAMAETGLPQGRIQGERGRTCGQLRLFASVAEEGSWVDARIDTALPDRAPLPKPDVRQVHIALGPVAVFGASNFPLAFSVAGGDTASALAAGCPVVVKGHPAHPGTSELVAGALTRAVAAAGLPAGWFSLIQGVANETSLQVVMHPAIQAVGFTGSLGAGRALFAAAASRPAPIPVYAEMGSVNPVFFLPGALKERGEQLAQGYAQSLTMGAGQFCTNPGLSLALVDEQLPDFIAQVTSAVQASTNQTMLHAGIATAYRAGLERLTGHAAVELLASHAGEGNEGGAAFMVTQAQALLDDPRLSEEVFGPSSLLGQCASRDEMLAMAESLEGHLTATLFGTDEELADYADLVAILERKVGRLIFNAFPTGVEVCPSMHHGGPYPATTNPMVTSVGTAAIKRFARPVCYQGWPESQLPQALQSANPRGLMRLVNASLSRDAL